MSLQAERIKPPSDALYLRGYWRPILDYPQQGLPQPQLTYHYIPKLPPCPGQGPKPDLGVPYYGTRYGHNFPQQIKQKMLDLNVTQVRFHIH